MKRLVTLLIVAAISMAMFGQDQKDLSKCAMVKILTNYGTMKVALYNETPQHRDNFIKLVRSNFYEDVLFHRIIRDFMAQAGDPQSKDSTFTGRLGGGGVGYTIPAEFVPELFHKKGALAAARQGDDVNPEKASSGCQFYIVTGRQFDRKELDMLEHRLKSMYGNPEFHYDENQILTYMTFGGAPHLDGGYTVFGELVDGFEILDIIDKVKTDATDRPIEPVKILSMSIIKNYKK
ncbi:MAG: peptidylprolyl isomerase [Paludibacteraceae bacterium]|nr:peptidylprolyl isomerase [Paludibacteraceae bacterium]